MNKTRLLSRFALLTLLFFFLTMGTYHFYTQYQQNHFSCDTMLLVRKDNSELALALNFTFQGDNGIVYLKGTLKQGENITNVSRKNYFNFNQNKGFYHLNSILTVTSPADNSNTEEIARVLPRFYLQRELKFDFSVYPVGKEGFVFSTGYVPSFYCARN